MKRNLFLVWLVVFIFAAISFSTNIIGPLEPNIRESFHLSSLMTGLIPYAFFIAYLFSIPYAMMLNKLKEKKSMLIAFFFAGSGALLFGLFPSYQLAFISFFMIGTGMAILQVVINPLLRAAGGEGHFAFYSVVAQVAFGGAAYLTPLVSTHLIEWIASGESPLSLSQELAWVGNYWFIGMLLIVLGLLITLVKFPKIELKAEEKTEGLKVYKTLLSNKTMWMYFFAIFAYVGLEQGISFKIKAFLMHYHSVSSDAAGEVVGNFWGALMIGCLVGLVLVKLVNGKTLLRWFTLTTIVLLFTAVFGTQSVSIFSFTAIGFTISIMWSINFSLAMNSFKEHHGAIAGILCTGIIGGGLVQPVIGIITDYTNLQGGMLFNVVLLAYILFISFVAKPLIENDTISLKKLLTQK